MAPPLIRCKAAKPFAWLGRYVGTGERLNLPEDVFEDLVKTGHVERVEVATSVQPVQPGRWTAPIER